MIPLLYITWSLVVDGYNLYLIWLGTKRLSEGRYTPSIFPLIPLLGPAGLLLNYSDRTWGVVVAILLIGLHVSVFVFAIYFGRKVRRKFGRE